MQVGGTGINIQSGRETTISPGCAALCDPDRGYGVDFVTPYELFVLELPVSNITLAHPGFDLDRAAGRAIDPSRSRLLISFLRTAWSQLASLADDADWRECIDRVGLDQVGVELVRRGDLLRRGRGRGGAFSGGQPGSGPYG